MKNKIRILLAAFVLQSTLSTHLSTAQAQGTAFTYQGRLTDNGAPANGTHDFTFTLYSAASGGATVGVSNVVNDLAVSNGLFTVTLDFGAAAFPGADRWLEIAVKPGGVPTNYTALSPRQQITATPYAIRAANFSGTLSPSQLPVSVVTNNGTGLSLGGTFSGNGAGLTNLNAWRLGGNAGTAPGANFIGTTDNQPLEFKANGSRVLRLAPDPTSPNLLAGSPANDTVGGIRGASVLGGGNASYPNRVAADYATVVGGISNTASGNASVAMGQFSTAGGYAAVASGYGTTAGGFSSFAAGNSARAAHDGSFVWGDNTFADFASTANNQFLIRAAGGVGINTNNPNGAALAVKGDVTADGKMNVIGSFKGGYFGNTISNGVVNGFIGGGGEYFYPNLVGNDYASVLGGFGNTASGYGSTAMGRETTAGADYSTAMGVRTIASGASSTAMGYFATASGLYSTAMGYYTSASGNYSTAMGVDTAASGSYSTAMGYLAKANHPGSFVWADTTFAQFASTKTNQFSLRASGGLRLSDSTSMEFGSTLRQMLNLWSTNYGIGVQASSLYFRCNNADANDGFIWYKGGVHSDGYANAGGGTELMHLVQGGLYVNGALVSTSDRNAKENFAPVDAQAVLEKVAALPLSRWNYKQDPSQQHLGPMAQDFHAAFGVGPDDKHIATVDADGVALAAIQGLNQKLSEELKRRDAENAELRRELNTIKTLLGRLTSKED